MRIFYLLFVVLLMSIFQSCKPSNNENLPFGERNAGPTPYSGALYEFDANSTPAWSSFENIDAERGAGGKENNGAKGHPYDRIEPGETKVLLNVEGAGIVNRMWVTIRERSPEMLRSLKLEMYWDGVEKPAVSVPFGDFFGIGLGKMIKFENALFANPEGRSFNSYVAMPFRTGARITVTNESDKPLTMIFFDIDIQKLAEWKENFMYFHAYWSRDTATVLGKDFEILPNTEGKGRFLGTNLGVDSNPLYKDNWWGEGEVKMYMDGDGEYASLVGTGTEDYIGTAWGQGEFINQYTGCPLASQDDFQWLFYRYHIPDPIFFSENLKVTIQQMGGAQKEKVIEMLKNGVDLIPVTIQNDEGMDHIYFPDSTVNLEDPKLRNGWTNYYRSDDVSATAYFYLDKPQSNLPPIQSVEMRTWQVK